MSLLKFLKDAGEKLFGGKEAQAAPAPAADPAAAQARVQEANAKAAEAIRKYIASQGLTADALEVSFDGATTTVTVSGVAADQATKEKIVLCCGNVAGVSEVNDLLTVAAPPEPESQFHLVAKGDTLSAIAKKFYGNANAYMKIYEANRPMLSHPDKIYPGQLLRIPPA